MSRKRRQVNPGDSFGQWTVLEFSYRGNDYRKYFWRCQCACGTVKDVNHSRLIAGRSTRCGRCANRRENNPNYFHGESNNRIYGVWRDMRSRCQVSTHAAYRHYGGRGIRVCERWQDFSLFFEDMGNPPDGKYSIERNDVNGNYEPSNCRWATMNEQARNRRNNRMLTHDGETMCVTDWANRIGMSCNAIRCRLKRGWSVEDALTTPSLKPRRNRGG